MKRLLPGIVWTACVATCVAVVVGAAEGDARKGFIENFRLPFFSREGFRTGDLRGASARYVDENRIEVTGVSVRAFSGDEAGRVTLEINTPVAVVERESSTVSGSEQLQVKGETFEIFGSDWSYQHNEKVLEIRRDVVVTFQGSIGDILK